MYNFIVNPKAGSGKGLKIWKAIARYMDSHNIEYEVFLTEGIGDARTAARRLTDSHDEPRYIIAVGGDGTMNEVLDGVSFHGPLSLGYIPAGSGNDLARSLRMPGRTIKCLKKQLAPRHFTLITESLPMETRRYPTAGFWSAPESDLTRQSVRMPCLPDAASV